MTIRYLGHACFEIKSGDHVLLIDPFISGNELASSVDIDALKPHFILLTHGHFDHCADAERIAKKANAQIISSYEIVDYYGKLDISGHPMNIGGKWDFPFGRVHMVEAVHTNTLPDGTPFGQAAGFVIVTPDHSVYIAGDTALTYNMKLIPELIGAPDLAILPVGDNFTMDYQAALKCAEFIQCNQVIASHYDTFGYIQVDQGLITEHFERSGKQIQFIPIGESLTV